MAKSHSIAFVYPPHARERKHGPSGYRDVQSFRPWLRDEFVFRCVYCLKRETWGTVREGFDIEHFVSSKVASNERLTYRNLVYACHECNLRKGSASVSDPVQCCTAIEIMLLDNGFLVGMTRNARMVIAVVALNSPKMIRWRKLWMQIVELAQTHDLVLLYQLLAYPDDLPDLETLKPPSNEKPQSVRGSLHVRQRNGNLPASYIT